MCKFDLNKRLRRFGYLPKYLKYAQDSAPFIKLRILLFEAGDYWGLSCNCGDEGYQGACKMPVVRALSAKHIDNLLGKSDFPEILRGEKMFTLNDEQVYFVDL